MTDESGFDSVVDFNLGEDAKAEPLVPAGNYTGNVTSVKFYPDGPNITFYVTLEGNGGVCSDGETPVDGANVPFKVWLPKAEDKDELTKSGRYTKFQWKVNNMQKVSDALGIDLGDKDAIRAGIEGAEWVGLEVVAKVVINEYEGNVSNQIDSMSLQ